MDLRETRATVPSEAIDGYPGGKNRPLQDVGVDDWAVVAKWPSLGSVVSAVFVFEQAGSSLCQARNTINQSGFIGVPWGGRIG